MAKKYLLISERLETLDIYFLDNDVDDIIENLNKFKVKYPKHSRLYIDASYLWNDMEIELRGQRDENDSERDARLASQRRVRDSRKEATLQEIIDEKKELKRLLDKYGEDITT